MPALIHEDVFCTGRTSGSPRLMTFFNTRGANSKVSVADVNNLIRPQSAFRAPQIAN